MSLYGSENTLTTEAIANSQQLMEMLLVDDILQGNDEQRKAFCESAEAQVLVEKAVLRKPTLMRLSKADDEKRRTKLVVYALAKAAKDPTYAKLVKFTKARKICIAKLMKKYGTKGAKVAKMSQKNYIKMASSGSTEDKK